jgi:hypothetical protein
MLAEAFEGDLRERGRHDPLVHPALALVSSSLRNSLVARNIPVTHVVARVSPESVQSGAQEHALFTVATMVGALVLACAVDDPRFSDTLRDAALTHLTARSS